jgi:beta-galactosidase
LFEGAGQITDVYLDDKHIHTHVAGYNEWKVDLTKYLDKASKTYTLSIRCDNSRNLEIIPSDLSDFNIYGGLYRNVNLNYEPNIYIEKLQITPIYDDINNGGVVTIIGEFNKVSSNLIVSITSYKDNEKIIFDEKEFSSNKRFKIDIDFDSDSVKAWSPDSPSLYKCKIKWVVNGETAFLEDSFGFRNFKFEKHGPFYLNGKRLLLKGTHRHEDHEGVGAAQNSESIEKEMHLIKEMGANFICLAHYQQS